METEDRDVMEIQRNHSRTDDRDVTEREIENVHGDSGERQDGDREQWYGGR